MKNSRFTEEQIIGILKPHEAGLKTADLLPGAWSQRSHVLRLEVEVRWNGSERGRAAASYGRREPAAEGAGCGSES